MDTIIKMLEAVGFGRNHPEHELLVELLITVKQLKETLEPFISNDPVKHRINLKIRGKVLPFLACQDDEYYLRKAAELINKKDV